MAPRRSSGLIERARSEVEGMAKGGMAHPSTKPVIAGAVIGALGGALLPVVTWLAGLIIGLLFAFYQRIK